MRPGLGHGYGFGTGTSDATAIVAGAAALVRAKYPNLSAKEVVHRLTATAIDKGAPGRDNVYGYGIVNLVGALTADVPPLETPATSSPPTAAPETDKRTNPWLFIAIGVGLAIVAGLGLLVATRHRTPG
jgi:subtilisin family serine protease